MRGPGSPGLVTGTGAGVGRLEGGSHGSDGLIVEGDKGHAKRLLVHLLLLPLVVLLQLLLQLRVVLDGLHLRGGRGRLWAESWAGARGPAALTRTFLRARHCLSSLCLSQQAYEVGTINPILQMRKQRHRAIKKLA